jgi:hypothetical protein
MRFMMLMIPHVYQGPGGKTLPADFAPDAEGVAEMTKYNEDLANSGALLSADGLHPIDRGARVSFPAGKPHVTDGPFTESKEVLGGYWIIQASSKEEAVEWARRCPARDGDVIEVRQVFEMADFPADVQQAAESPALRAHLEHRKQ